MYHRSHTFFSLIFFIFLCGKIETFQHIFRRKVIDMRLGFGSGRRTATPTFGLSPNLISAILLLL
jgi:hypothetical protein